MTQKHFYIYGTHLFLTVDYSLLVTYHAWKHTKDEMDMVMNHIMLQ